MEKLNTIFDTYTTIEQHSADHITVRVPITAILTGSKTGSKTGSTTGSKTPHLQPWKYSRSLDILRCEQLARQYMNESNQSQSQSQSQSQNIVLYAAFFQDSPGVMQIYEEKGYYAIMALRLLQQTYPTNTKAAAIFDSVTITLDIRDNATTRDVMNQLEERECGWC